MIPDTFALISLDLSNLMVHRNKVLKERAKLRIENATFEEVLIFTDASWKLNEPCIAGVAIRIGIVFVSWR